LADLVDVAVWVQSDFDEARRLGVSRDVVDQGLDPVVALQYWREWEAEEVPFLVDDRPWERADFIVASAPILAHDPRTEVVITPPLRDAASPEFRHSP
jgi:hypothetical protein